MNVVDLVVHLSTYPADARVKVEVVSDGGEIGGSSLCDIGLLAKSILCENTVVIFLED